MNSKHYQKMVSVSNGEIKIRSIFDAELYAYTQGHRYLHNITNPPPFYHKLAQMILEIGNERAAAKILYLETNAYLDKIGSESDPKELPYASITMAYRLLRKHNLTNLAWKLLDRMIFRTLFMFWDNLDRKGFQMKRANDMVPRDKELLDMEYLRLFYTVNKYYILTQSDNGKFGYKDPFDRWVIDPIYSYAKPFDRYYRIACVKLNGKWGAIDPNGRIVIECIYDKPFSAQSNELLSLLKVSLNGRLGLMDLLGHVYWNDEMGLRL